MSRPIYRSVNQPIREGISWDEKWRGPDEGLIFCWEVGRLERDKYPQRASLAEKGELFVMDWKGGVEKKLSGNLIKKDGSLNYLATWHGLRNEDLDLDLDAEYTLTCSQTGQVVLFSRHPSKK